MLLLETIKIHNKHFCNIECHNERFNQARIELFDCKNELDLENEIQIPEAFQSGPVKCRVTYSHAILNQH